MNQYPAISITQYVVCVGSLTAESFNVCEHLPEEGTDVTCLHANWRRGGHASNVSFVLRMLGAQVIFLGMLSRSNLLLEFMNELRSCNVLLDFCPRTNELPAFTTIIQAKKGGGRSVLHCNNHFPYVTLEDFKAIDLSRCCWVHFEARDIKETALMMRHIRDFNNTHTPRVRISMKVNSNYTYRQSRDLFLLCDYLLFSGNLAQQLGWKTPEEACQELNNDLNMPRAIKVPRPCIVCSWGRLGAGCLTAKGVYEEVPAYKNQRIVDTYGAGECFTAAFIYGIYLRGLNLRSAVDLANRMASHKISAVGYGNLATFTMYPNLVSKNDDRGSHVSDNDEEDDRVCRKFLNRVVKYSNGKAATLLLGRFNPKTADKVKRVDAV